MNKANRLITQLSAAVLASSVAFASAQADDKRIPEKYGYAGIHASHYWFDDYEVLGGLDELEDYTTLGLQGGYRFKPNWSMQLWWEKDETRLDHLNFENDVSNSFLSVRYHFKDSYIGNWEPYLGLAAGHQEVSFKGPGEDSDSLVGPELGIQRMQGEHLVWDLGGRLPFNTDDETSDGEVYLALNFIFGASNASTDDSSDEEPTKQTEQASDAEQSEAEQMVQPKQEEAQEEPEAMQDADGDGVADAADQCPNTPAGALVTSDGCQKMLKENIDITLRVEFETGKAVVKRSSYEQILEVANVMKQYPSTEITLEGHTDNTGNADFNKRLSSQRAAAVKTVLVDEYGIEAGRVSTIGKGEEQPIADNGTAAGRSQNRRVEARIQASREVPQTN